MARDGSEVIEEAIRRLSPSVDPSGAICTGWVMVAEWVDASGRWWVTKWSDKGTPPWRAEGLMYHALNSEE